MASLGCGVRIAGLDFQMGLRITQHKAARFGDDDGIGVSLAGGPQVEHLAVERNVGIFRDIFRIDDHGVIAVATLVKNLAQDNIELSELAAQLGEVYAPLCHCL